MEELFLFAIGVGALALSPIVPALRPVAKVAVKGGLAVEGAVITAAAVLDHQLDKMRSKSNTNGEVIDGQVAAAEPSVAEAPEAVAEAPEAVAEAPEAVVEAPEAVVEAPEAVVEAPEAVVEAPEAVAEPVEVEEVPVETPAMETAPSAETVAEPVEAEAAPAAETGPTKAAGPGLIDVDGIGPKVVTVLESAGITTLEQLEATDEARLREILTAAGSNYRSMNPSSWPEQARQLLGNDS